MQEIIELTKELIRFKTMHKNQEEILRCAGFIEAYFKKHDIVCKRVEHAGTPSIFVVPAGKTVPVILMSHIDVVDAPDELFEPVEKEGKLYGRGSIDDKYAAALSMVLVKEHVARLRKKGMGQADLPFGVLITGAIWPKKPSPNGMHRSWSPAGWCSTISTTKHPKTATLLNSIVRPDPPSGLVSMMRTGSMRRNWSLPGTCSVTRMRIHSISERFLSSNWHKGRLWT